MHVVLVIFRTWSLFLAWGLRTFHLYVYFFISSFLFMIREGKSFFWIGTWALASKTIFRACGFKSFLHSLYMLLFPLKVYMAWPPNWSWPLNLHIIGLWLIIIFWCVNINVYFSTYVTLKWFLIIKFLVSVFLSKIFF